MDVIPEEADFVIQEVLHVHSVSYTEFSGRWPCHEPEVYRLGVEQLVREFRLPPCHEPPIEIGKMPLPSLIRHFGDLISPRLWQSWDMHDGSGMVSCNGQAAEPWSEARTLRAFEE
jgi:hypothetical protein